MKELRKKNKIRDFEIIVDKKDEKTYIHFDTWRNVERSQMRNLVKLFKALSDSNRIRIIKMLQIRPLCVCEITAILNLATSTVSKHLSLLRDADLIYDIKDAKWVNYYLNTKSDEKIIRQIISLLEEWLPDDAIVLQDAEQVKTVDRNLLCGG